MSLATENAELKRSILDGWEREKRLTRQLATYKRKLQSLGVDLIEDVDAHLAALNPEQTK